jgi:hypothetical protein
MAERGFLYLLPFDDQALAACERVTTRHGMNFIGVITSRCCVMRPLAVRPDDAAEIVQQTYLRIARHIKPFTDEGDFWRWLAVVFSWQFNGCVFS